MKDSPNVLSLFIFTPLNLFDLWLRYDRLINLAYLDRDLKVDVLDLDVPRHRGADTRLSRFYLTV